MKSRIFTKLMRLAVLGGYLVNAACTAAEFSQRSSKSENTSSSANSNSVDQTLLQADDSIVGICNYPQYSGPLNSPSESECHSTRRPDPRSPNRLDGATYIISMYNASNLSHGLIPTTFREIVTQKVNIAATLGDNSVDLVLYSYEPVHWRIEGQTGAVRSVHVRGYHCATVAGVDSSIVSIDTYDQGKSPNADALPLSNNIALDTSIYEGSCVAGNRFEIR